MSYSFILGEFARTLDERFRISIPTELAEPLLAAGAQTILAKQQPGCLSLWPAAEWQQKIEAGIAIVEGKLRAGKLQDQLADVQTLGRLLSTRHRPVQLAGRGRLSVPEGFREFLQVEPGTDAMVVGAGLCVEIWKPAAWLAHLESRIPEFGRLLDQLSA
ncbi:MAG TPA: division/cell wall cluster transcriptional repressor MraZ [Pirellulales bacterium]|jgi:MraZ protein|nr:division/cell wall cluster transcriptional repressor MraZ [Pirellulales bacterium]